jgi:hypothetical protein
MGMSTRTERLCCPEPSRPATRACPLFSLQCDIVRAYIDTMPSLIPLDNLLGAFFLGVVLSSVCVATFDFYEKLTRWRQVVRRDMFAGLLVLFAALRE